jgi:uncharacterized protein (DUF2062 family)
MNKWLDPFIKLLKQGISPEKLALTVALGTILGVTPVLGSTTLLCTVAALVLGLNLPAIQMVNGLVYPLQFVLLIPYYRMGAWMFRTDASSISLGGVMELVKSGVLHAIQTLWVVTVHALVAWLLSGIVMASVLYVALVPVMKLLWNRVAKQPAISEVP